MRSRRFAAPRTKKIRPPVTVRERVAKKGGRCAGCRNRYEVGDMVTRVVYRRKVYHTTSCVPANAGQMPVAGAAPLVPTPEAVVRALSTSWSIGEAKMVGMLALENALVTSAKNRGITPEMEKAFDKYNKLKGMAMRPGSPNEGEMAQRFAILELCKLVF